MKHSFCFELIDIFRYKIVAKISFGSYGSIFVGDDITTPDQQVAVKFEMLPNNKNGGSGAAVSERKNEEMHLRYEYEVYKVVQVRTSVKSLCRLYHIFIFREPKVFRMCTGTASNTIMKLWQWICLDHRLNIYLVSVIEHFRLRYE